MAKLILRAFMKRVAILSYPSVAFFELGCAVELFGLPRPEFEDWYECDVVSFVSKPLETTSGIKLICKQIDNFNDYDLVVVPSWPVHKVHVPDDLSAELCKFYADNKQIISFCSGAFLLATLGFLSNRQAITHWRYADEFKSRFPSIEYIEDTLYCFDGQVGCSAGSAAGLDLGLEIIRQDFGHHIANAIARRLVISAHRKGSQSQFSEKPMSPDNSRFSAAIDWALKNLNSNIDMSSFADKAVMSRRSFDRKFKATFNLTPKEWLTFQRLNFAKSMLETKPYSVEKVAELSGFNNGITMRHHFRKELGISPTYYREQFKELDKKTSA